MKRLAGDRRDFADQRKRLVLENRKTCRKIQKSSQVLAKMDGNIVLAVHSRSRRIPIPSYFDHGMGRVVGGFLYSSKEGYAVSKQQQHYTFLETIVFPMKSLRIAIK